MIFISVLCLISGAFAEGNEELDYNAFDSVMVSGIADFDVVFELLPEAYNATESAHPGTVERLHYTTAVYEDGVTYEKYCTVYLPYGYDPENKEYIIFDINNNKELDFRPKEYKGLEYDQDKNGNSINYRLEYDKNKKYIIKTN